MGEKQRKFQSWKIVKLEAQRKENDEFWSERDTTNRLKQQCLATELSDIKKKFEASTQKLQETESELNKCKRINKHLTLENSQLREDNDRLTAKLKKTQESHRQRLNDLTESHAKSLEEVKQKNQKVMSRKQTDFDKRLALQKEAGEKALKELEEKDQCELLKIEEQLRQAEETSKQMAEKFKLDLLIAEGRIMDERKLRDTDRLNNRVFCKSLELKIERQAKTITALKNQDHLIRKVSKLEDTVKEKDVLIRNKDKNIASLKAEKKGVIEEFQSERQKTAILTELVKDLEEKKQKLEEELRSERGKLKNTTDDLNKSRRINGNLTERVEHLKSKVMASEPDLIKLKDKVSHMETYQLRMKEDIQSFMAVINEPQKLRSRVITIKRRYVDNEDNLELDEQTKHAVRNGIKYLKAESDTLRKALDTSFRDKERLAKGIDRMYKLKCDTECYYAEVLHQKKMEERMSTKQMRRSHLSPISPKSNVTPSQLDQH
ncbi:myosin-11-like [Lates japonicus]|uniref:Myosin-11-like protein n=1 Tax=Lates japonicus TaxID=270547 RepID=A0AAD3N4J1_LATJO|nr:myosin-11-like protein [Lates japonicus]